MENISANFSLRSLQEIPEVYRSLFSTYPCFNRVQSAVFDDIIYSNASLVITAPTGSGKTVVFELAILKLMMDYPDLKSVKIVYVAPVKALCNERFNDWHARFEAFNMSVIEVTGDSIDHCDLQDHQIIITTPEKWDSLTRRWRDNVSLVQMVKLVMIDEVHLLSDNKRGPILETIVCRMKTVMRVLKLQTSLRFIAVSATIFNIEDLARWLGTSETDYKFYRFGQEVRPVSLNRVVKGYPISKSPYLFDIQLSYKLKSLLMEYGNGKPTLIFCSTRRGVVQTCKTLMENVSFNFTREQILVLEEISAKITDVKLKEYIRLGGAYHHAGMAFEDRQLVQNAFADGLVPVLVATSTLAMGVNLPAHLVIIKSTHQYIAGRIVEYSESSVLQMVGRAGRPQFDTTATAIIMTKSQMVHKYQNLLDCKEVIESSLHLHLPEQLNAEIVLLTIFDLSVAMQWIQCTFFYVRALKNPQYYGLSGNNSKIEKDLELMVLRAINALKRFQLIDMNENGLDITPTINGRLMSHYYINFNTFQLFFKITEVATVKEIIEILSNANELNEIQLRVNDRKPLNELNINKNTETIRFQLNGKIKTRELKINCLLQACLGCLPMDSNLQQEAIRIINVLERIVKCLTEFLTKKNSYCSLLSSVILSKCLHAKLWENSAFVARQLDRIGATLGSTLVALGKTSFNSLIQSHPHELERIVNRGPPFGSLIIEQVRHLPMYSLAIQVDRKSVINYTIHIKISIINRNLLLIHNTAGSNHSIVLIVGDTNNRLIMVKRIFDENILNDDFEVAVEINPPMPQKVFIHVISEQWVGIDILKDILINPMASIVVGSNCYLPDIVQNPKKKDKKIVEEKTTKENAVMKRVSKLVPTKVVPKNQPNLNNFDNYCCFDLEPDWVENSPELNETNLQNVEKLTRAIDNDMPCEVPDISSPLQSEFIQDDFIDNQGMYKPESILSNNSFAYEIIERVPECVMVRDDNIQCEQSNATLSNTNFLVDREDNKTNSTNLACGFKPENVYISSTENMPHEAKAFANSQCFNYTNTSSNEIHNYSKIISNVDEKSFVNNIRNDIWRHPKSFNSSENDEILRHGNIENSELTNAPLRQFSDKDSSCYYEKMIFNLDSLKAKFSHPNSVRDNYSSTTVHNGTWRQSNPILIDNDLSSNSNIGRQNIPTLDDDDISLGSKEILFSNPYQSNLKIDYRDMPITTTVDYDSRYKAMKPNFVSKSKFNNLFDDATSNPKVDYRDNHITTIVNNDSCYQAMKPNFVSESKFNNLFNDATSSNIIEPKIDYQDTSSTTVEDSACYQLKPISSINNDLVINVATSNPKIDYHGTPSTTADEVPCYQPKPFLFHNHNFSSNPKSDNFLNVATLYRMPENDSSYGCNSPLGADTDNPFTEPINEISNSLVHQETPILQNYCEDKPSHLSSSNIIKTATFNYPFKNNTLNHCQNESNVRNIELPKLQLAEENSTNNMKDCMNANPSLQSTFSDMPLHLSRNGILKSAILNHIPKNVKLTKDMPGKNVDNYSNPTAYQTEPVLQGNCSDMSLKLSRKVTLKSAVLVLDHLPKNVETDRSEVQSNFETPKKLKLSEEIRVNKKQDSNNQNKNVMPWQVAEILTPVDCNIASQNILKNKDNGNIQSIMSQILPQNSFVNTQSVDPSETTTNWNEFEQNLLSGSQKKSKLSAFREKFCYKKSGNTANYPFISQTSQKTLNSTQESDFKKFNILTPKSINSFDGQNSLKANIAHQEIVTEKTISIPEQSSFALGNRNNMNKEFYYNSNRMNKENIPLKSLKSFFAAAQAAKSKSDRS